MPPGGCTTADENVSGRSVARVIRPGPQDAEGRYFHERQYNKLHQAQDHGISYEDSAAPPWNSCNP